MMFARFYEDTGVIFKKLRPIEINLRLIDYFDSARSGTVFHFTPSVQSEGIGVGGGHLVVTGAETDAVTASYDEVFQEVTRSGLADQFVSLTKGSGKYAVNLALVAVIKTKGKGSHLKFYSRDELKVDQSPDEIRSRMSKCYLPSAASPWGGT
jgi:hypothetical protein